MTEDTYDLTRHRDALAVVRLARGSQVPSWASASTLFSVTATNDETSVVCHASSVPRTARKAGPFVAFEVTGPLDLALTGVLHRLLGPPAEARISVFTISTFDTDWILVPAAKADRAEEAWVLAGHTVHPPTSSPPSPAEDDG
jgi:hypothetical protein